MSGPTFEAATQAIRERLSDEAVGHCLRVAELAGLLATLYGVDAEDARLAGLLHDWDRERPAGELVAECVASGCELDPAEESVPYLLHARTGAAALRREYPDLSREVTDAVARHTLGDVVMSDLDKVVYIADMIEPARRFQGVEDLREAIGTVSLADLFAQAYQRSVTHLIEVRKTIHPLTADVWNRYVARPRS